MRSKEYLSTISRYQIYNKVAKQKILDYKIYLVPKEYVKKKIVREIEKNAYQVGKKIKVKNINETQRGVIEDVCVDFDINNFERYDISLNARCGTKLLNLKLDKKIDISSSEIEF
ncbi:MAG TPA: hypothetical protein DEG69_18310 [Flavobacteriaceae bacterium]|nr:hypothetical protein [Flavobacteriaceae bacterium]|tara:strand:+ start:389 stop:733 length:345 start_codon:yes stop_codon:yes gene_type:complete